VPLDDAPDIRQTDAGALELVLAMEPLKDLEELAKVYRLTRKGRTELEREIADWRRLSQAIGWILQT
jgi:hypothetical protein